MIGTQAYQQIKACIDHQGHRFAANLVRVVVCERCGMTRQEATGGIVPPHITDKIAGHEGDQP